MDEDFKDYQITPSDKFVTLPQLAGRWGTTIDFLLKMGVAQNDPLKFCVKDMEADSLELLPVSNSDIEKLIHSRSGCLNRTVEVTWWGMVGLLGAQRPELKEGQSESCEGLLDPRLDDPGWIAWWEAAEPRKYIKDRVRGSLFSTRWPVARSYPITITSHALVVLVDEVHKWENDPAFLSSIKNRKQEINPGTNAPAEVRLTDKELAELLEPDDKTGKPPSTDSLNRWRNGKGTYAPLPHRVESKSHRYYEPQKVLAWYEQHKANRAQTHAKSIQGNRSK